MGEVLINEQLEDLREENKRLSNELNFERNLVNILENIRNNSLILTQNCKCIENRNTLNVIKQFNSIYTDLKAKQNLLKLKSNQNNNLFIESKSSDQRDYNFGLKSKSNTNTGFDGIQPNSVKETKPKIRRLSDQKMIKTKQIIMTSDCLPIKPKVIDSKTDSNSSFGLITEILDLKDKSVANFSQLSNVLSVTKLQDIRNSSDFHCNQCEDCFVSEVDLGIHMNRFHKQKPSFVCRICLQIFFSSDLLKQHLSESHCSSPSVKSSNVKSIPKKRQKKKILNISNVRTTSKRLDQNSCIRCRQQFINRQQLLSHNSSVHNIPVLECDLCDYKTERRQTLIRHKEAMHSTDRPYKCPVVGCDKWFKTKHNISAHKKKMHL